MRQWFCNAEKKPVILKSML